MEYQIKSTMLNIYFLIFLAFFVNDSHQRIQGAPLEACNSMTPAHRAISPQTTEPPYVLWHTAPQMIAGSLLNITLSTLTDAPIRGLMVQGRSIAEVGGPAVGSWVQIPALTQTLDCNATADAVTHTSIEDKTKLIFTWRAPLNYEGGVIFMATVAEKYDTFWIGIESQIVVVTDD